MDVVGICKLIKADLTEGVVYLFRIVEDCHVHFEDSRFRCSEA